MTGFGRGGFVWGFLGCETVLLLYQVLKWWQCRITMETQPLLGSQC